MPKIKKSKDQLDRELVEKQIILLDKEHKLNTLTKQEKQANVIVEKHNVAFIFRYHGDKGLRDSKIGYY